MTHPIFQPLMELERLPRWVRLLAAAALYFLILAADYATGWDVPLRELYFAPVVAAAWTLSASAGFVASLVGSVTALVFDVGYLGMAQHGVFLAVDAAVRLLVLCTATVVIRSLHDSLGFTQVENRKLRADAEVTAAAYRVLFEGSPLPLLVCDAESGDVVTSNEAAQLLYGYSGKQFEQLNIAALSPEAERLTAELIAPTEPSSGTLQCKRRDGEDFIAELTARTLALAGRRARIIVVKDITASYEVERMRALLAAVVQSAQDPIITCGLDDSITSWNAAAERVFGYDASEIIGKPMSLLIAQERLADDSDKARQVREGHTAETFDTVAQGKGCTRIDVACAMTPIRGAGGNIVGIARCVRDLTQERAAASKLKRVEEQFRQAQKMEAVGRLAGGVAHDFNNLLSVILGYSSMIVTEQHDSERVVDDVSEIRRAAERAVELTRQLLAFSRSKVIEAQVVDVKSLLTHTKKMLDRVLGEDVQLEMTCAQDLQCVRADPNGLEQMVMNLAVNARDAMPSGGTLSLRASNVRLDVAIAGEERDLVPGDYVQLSVTDTGVGMDQVTQAHIFEPFFTTKEVGKGTGLGLSMAYGMIQQCNGSISVQSAPGKGTTFTLLLPSVERPSATSSCENAEPSVGHETILLVEDEEQVRAVARRILTRSGYKVIEAPNGEVALTIAREHFHEIDLVLTDVVMPKMGGPELALRIQNHFGKIHLLFMSGYTEHAALRQGVLGGDAAFLHKPFTAASLTNKVREVLHGCAQAGHSVGATESVR